MLRRAASAVPDFALAASYLITWISPDAFGSGSLTYLTLVIQLEFIVIHSSAFMGSVATDSRPRPQKIARIVGLGLLYSLFVVAYALAFEQWWPITAFWMLTLNRLTGVLFSTAPTGEERAAVQSEWVISTALYVGWITASELLPVPRFGITPDFLAAHRPAGPRSSVDGMHRNLAFGAGYFLSQGLVELYKVRLWASRE